MEMKAYQVAEADGICYKCQKHLMKDCECFFGRLFIDDQPERSKREDSSTDEMRCSEHCGNTVRDK